MSKLIKLAGIVGCSFCAGILIGGSAKDFGKILAMGSLISIPTCYGIHVLIDERANKRVSKAEKKATEAATALDRAQSRLTDIERGNATLASDLENLKKQLLSSESDRSQQSNRVAMLTPAVAKLEVELKAANERREYLEACVREWEKHFDSRVEDATNKRFQEARKGELEKIFTEHDAVTQQAMALFRQLQGWGEKVSHSHRQKRELIKGLAAQYNQNLDEINAAVSKEREQYLLQIEALHEKVGALQHELAGDLLEPVYGKFGYQWDARIADDIARKVWDSLHIPLAVKGFKSNCDGSAEAGYGYSREQSPEALVRDLQDISGDIAKSLGIHKITSVRKHDLSDLLIVSWRREAAIKEDTVRLLAGTAEEFIAYITSHPIRYRLIADPGQGKTPTTAVMVSEILKVGGTRGNTGKGKKIPNTLVTVSCPDVESSQKDADYPLEIFLKYGNTTAAVKSIDDALEDWQYRKRDTAYADNFFQLWVWDELDNTLSSCSDPKGTGEAFKKILKQCHHTGVGWIVSGQSVMTSQIPGFMDDDRELFTQILIGVAKIRKYLEKYGKKVLSAKVVSQLLKNLEELEPYIENKNERITDSARLLRLALVLDDKSPKLYFLPNLDRVKFDAEKIEAVITQSEQTKRHFLALAYGQFGQGLGGEVQKYYSESIPSMGSYPPNLTRGVSTQFTQSTQKPHCPHCGGSILELVENETRYQCGSCKTASNRPRRFVIGKAIWK